MFAMSHPYGYPAAPPPRQYSGTSSAFSSSANPDEDWTKISDLAERRRIQNRIAQRNYRKKLKRRLEDLERRAGTSDGASSSSGNEKQGSSASSSSSRSSSSTAKASRAPSSKSSKSASQPQIPQQQHTPPQQPMMSPPKMSSSQFTPPMHHDDDLMFAHSYDERERSHTPPGLFAYAYPPPEDMMLAPYGASGAPHHHAQASYRPMTTSDAYPEYLVPTTVPVTLPSMTHFSDAIKREPYPGEEMTPYMSYGFIPGMDVNAPAPYDHSNPHTPPLSHGFDTSTSCSDSGYEYPTTPLSMPGSPGMIQH